ncbi:MAG TPA: TIGR02611 family protein [Candidatus Chromulinivoraceae bacterium]|nr:TIGR02611 family protein [Candidatus Chromulinivoraceae bacterium]
MDKVKKQAKRGATALVGGIILLVGVVAIPYPGPGWLIVFAGLAILATEFAWAQRLLDKVKGGYDKWQVWLKRQSVVIRAIVLALTGLIVAMTLWLLNMFGVMDNILHFNITWLHSPLGFFTK